MRKYEEVSTSKLSPTEFVSKRMQNTEISTQNNLIQKEKDDTKKQTKARKSDFVIALWTKCWAKVVSARPS